MSKPETWQKRVSDLADRSWVVDGIRKRLNNLRQNGFGPKVLDWTAMQANFLKILDRVQHRAEEYEYLSHSSANCL